MGVDRRRSDRLQLLAAAHSRRGLIEARLTSWEGTRRLSYTAALDIRRRTRYLCGPRVADQFADRSHSLRRNVRRAAVLAATAGGVLWLLLWTHQLAAHGTTEENEKRIVIGLSWMDSAKFYVLCFLLFLVSALAAYQSAGRPSPSGLAALALTAGGLLTVATATAVQFWPVAWGSLRSRLRRSPREVWRDRPGGREPRADHSARSVCRAPVAQKVASVVGSRTASRRGRILRVPQPRVPYSRADLGHVRRVGGVARSTPMAEVVVTGGPPGST